jgi:hypothetical protein
MEGSTRAAHTVEEFALTVMTERRAINAAPKIDRTVTPQFWTGAKDPFTFIAASGIITVYALMGSDDFLDLEPVRF